MCKGMKRIAAIALGSMITVQAYSCGAVVSGFDGFPAKIELKSDKSVYHAGEDIRLTITFFYGSGYKMRLYRDLSKSASLTIGNWAGGRYTGVFCNPTLKELNESRMAQRYVNDPMEEIQSPSSQVFTREISGSVRMEGEKIKVRFENFGSFELGKPEELSLMLHFWPVNPDPIDSLEATTNTIKIFFDK